MKVTVSAVIVVVAAVVVTVVVTDKVVVVDVCVVAILNVVKCTGEFFKPKYDGRDSF